MQLLFAIQIVNKNKYSDSSKATKTTLSENKWKWVKVWSKKSYIYKLEEIIKYIYNLKQTKFSLHVQKFELRKKLYGLEEITLEIALKHHMKVHTEHFICFAPKVWNGERPQSWTIIHLCWSHSSIRIRKSTELFERLLVIHRFLLFILILQWNMMFLKVIRLT